jgi:hypothetical protein
MFKKQRRRWQLAKVRPGDGSRLPRFRVWHLLSRSLYVLELPDDSGRPHRYEVDVRHLRDSSSTKRPAALYRDGVQVGQANLPVTFPVPGGVIEVATTQYGLKRMHHVTDDGHERALRPDPRSLEGRWARFGRRFPRTSTAIGVVGLVVLLVGLVGTLSAAAEQLTRVEVVAQHIGTYTPPIRLPLWLTTALAAAGALAATERALRLKSTWMAD